MKRIQFILRLVFIGWWFIPLVWVVCFPLGLLLTSLEDSIEYCCTMTKYILYGITDWSLLAKLQNLRYKVTSVEGSFKEE